MEFTRDEINLMCIYGSDSRVELIRILSEMREFLTPEEIEEVREYIIGQCSDGWGKSFEQRGIKTKNGTLYCHFWHTGDDYFMLTTEEFERRMYGDRNDGE